MLSKELRYGLRAVLKQRVFTAVAVATLALTLGASTGVFNALYSTLFRPLPYPNARELHWLYQVSAPGAGAGPHKDRSRVSSPVFEAWQRGSRSFSQIEAYRGETVALGESSSVEPVVIAKATSEFLPMLGLQLQRGRSWTREAGDSEVVIAHSFWRTRFGGRDNVLGESIQLDGKPHVVVGVLPADFSFEPDVQIWKPLLLSSQSEPVGALRVYGRLLPSVDPALAREELSRLGAVAAMRPGETFHGAAVMGLQEKWSEASKDSLELVTGVALLLLALACANLINLSLAQGNARRHELATRLALGASRADLIRMFLVESAIRTAIGAVVGLVIAAMSGEAIAALMPPQLAAVAGWSPQTVAITAVVAVTISIVTGLIPALIATRSDLSASAFRESTASSSSFLRAVLVVAQLSLSVAPLVGAGLLAKTLWNLQRVPLGFDADSVAVATLRFRGADESVKRRVLERVREEAWVDSAGMVSVLPLTGEVFRPSERFKLFTSEKGAAHEARAGIVAASDGYFDALRIRVKQGRAFLATDTSSSLPVALVNESFVRRHFRDQDAVGRSIELESESVARVIVGVVDDVQMEGLATSMVGDVYIPVAQDEQSSLSLAVRSRLPLAESMTGLQRILHVTGLSSANLQVRSLASVVESSAARVRVVGALLGACALLAILIANVGLYGALAFWVSQRTRELGIRAALGATPAQLRMLVFGQGLRLALVSCAVGTLATLLFSRALSKIIFGVTVFEPLILLAAVGALLFTATLACWGPARRAVDVSTVLQFG